MKAIGDADLRRLAEINFGPWDRIDNFTPFVPGAGPHPDGANYYPHDMTKAEFDSVTKTAGFRADSLKGQYTMVRRDATRALIAIPFHVMFKPQHDSAASLLEARAKLAAEPGLTP